MSASVIALSRDFPADSIYRHAEGHPARTAFEDCSGLFAALQFQEQ